MFSLRALEARSRKSRCLQGHTTFRLLGGGPSCLFSSWGLQWSLGCGHVTLISASASQGLLRLCLLTCTSQGHLSLDVGSTQDDLISKSFVASAKTLFCNKVILTHGFWELGRGRLNPLHFPSPCSWWDPSCWEEEPVGSAGRLCVPATATATATANSRTGTTRPALSQTWPALLPPSRAPGDVQPLAW